MTLVREQMVELVRLMVDEPREVEIDEIEDGDEAELRLIVAEDDLGKVIGRQGRTARALRALLAGRDDLDGPRYSLEILDD